MNIKTVEKIGGTSMSRFSELIGPLFLDKQGQPRYKRIFVVSAYGGITDLLLEHKHSGEPGVFTLFSEGEDEDEWQTQLTTVGNTMRAINEDLFNDPALLELANSFVQSRIEDARQCLLDVRRVCRFGSFDIDLYLGRVRELLSSMGEAHSAYNATLLLQQHKINACFVDLTGWRDNRLLSLDERITTCLADIDFDHQLPIVTGYGQCTDGLVKRYGRGYTEITTCRLATLLMPEEVVIHKEYHLSSADPKIVGDQKSQPIGQTNYDVADQLANLGMEAIHPNAATMLRKRGIPLRIKHAFEPDHRGTLIQVDYQSDTPKVEIVAGRRNVMALEVFDQDMVGRQLEFESRFIDVLQGFKVKSIGKDVNANSITHYVACPLRTAKRVSEKLELQFKDAVVVTRKVAFVCAIGTDMDLPGILAQCTRSLGEADVGILSASQPLRGVDARFVVEEDNYIAAVNALHDSVIQNDQQVDKAA
ncbi:MAG: aspartate kinase [bacterium]